MENQIIPSYSGVTINISNPTVNAGGDKCKNDYCALPQTNNCITTPEMKQYPTMTVPTVEVKDNQPKEIPQSVTYAYPQAQENNSQAYPPAYYMNNYNIQQAQPNELKTAETAQPVQQVPVVQVPQDTTVQTPQPQEQDEDLSVSNEIINQLDERNEAQKETEKNSKKTNVVALTNEYIMSLENYLNNPNTDIRLMAAKDILTRLDEDKDRYDDAALNALLNKMLQDPEKLVRIAAMSAFSSGLASGNDYTVKLLNDIQQDPNADKEDVVDAANILLRMSASTDVKYEPQPLEQEVEKE